jgi:hypothetical protein
MKVGSVPVSERRPGFWWAFHILSGVLSTLAIAALARRAFEVGSLSVPLALVMDAYNSIMRLVLGWAEPYLQASLSWFGGLIGWRPTVYPHWKDAFVRAGSAISDGRIGGSSA